VPPPGIFCPVVGLLGSSNGLTKFENPTLTSTEEIVVVIFELVGVGGCNESFVHGCLSSNTTPKFRSFVVERTKHMDGGFVDQYHMKQIEEWIYVVTASSTPPNVSNVQKQPR
jgi:hypothetical protein